MDAARSLRQLPLAFVENLGQWDAPGRYVARGGGLTVWLEDDAMALQIEGQRRDDSPVGSMVRLAFEGGAEGVELVGEDPLEGQLNYFVGSDQDRWRKNVTRYRSVRYLEVWEGVDIRVREGSGRTVEYDLHLAPGADLRNVVLRCVGAIGLCVEPDGGLSIETAAGEIRMSPPVSWEEDESGERFPIASRTILLGDGRFCFDVPRRSEDRTLVIDPGLTYSTYLGGSNWEHLTAIAMAPSGAATVVGITRSLDFPTQPGSYQPSHANSNSDDVIVARLSPDGSSLEFATYLGGAQDDAANAVTLDSRGAPVICGFTGSPSFPTTPGAFSRAFSGKTDVFVARLSPEGSTLEYATFIGGSGVDVGRAIDLDASGSMFVGGSTLSPDFPTTPGSFDPSFNGLFVDMFVVRLSAAGDVIEYGTYLGGGRDENFTDLAVDAAGVATVVGYTDSINYPTTPGSIQPTYLGGFDGDGVVTRLSASGATAIYSTYFGTPSSDQIWAVAVDEFGFATIGGNTSSRNFPTTPGAFAPSGSAGGFLTRLSPAGDSLVWSTHIGSGNLSVTDVDLLPGGAVVASGRAFSTATFPATPGAFSQTNLITSGFVALLAPAGDRLFYGSYFGGTATDVPFGVAGGPTGTATVVGYTSSADFPTTPHAFDTSYEGTTDGFVIQFDLLPTGASAYGASTPGCGGPLAIGVTSWPQVGNSAFSLTCTNTAPSALGLFLLRDAPLAQGVPVLGADLWVDFTTPGLTSLVLSSPSGFAEFQASIPNDSGLVGRHFYAQFLWQSPASPGPCPLLGVSASNALELVILP